MSDPKNFLSRWSQRKLNPQAEEPAPSDQAAPPPAHSNAGASPAAPEPELDITRLPPLESIGANTDVRVFLQRGVPASLRHAALRRAWSADPAIRDFVGLSENSWDFNAQDSLLGFGPIDPEDVKRVAARLFGAMDQETAGEALTAREHDEIASAHEAVSESQSDASLSESHASDAATQQEQPIESRSATAAPRRHGSALPK
jgi:hypothetical protein